MAMILDAFVEVCIDRLFNVAEEEISMLPGVETELMKLQRRMGRIAGFLESAEKKRYIDRSINKWVMELKDVAYDADDIIDRCMIEGRKLLEDRPSKSVVRHHYLSLFSCLSCLKSCHVIGSEIRKLNDRWKEIVEDGFILSKLEPTRQGDQVGKVNHRQTISTEVKSDILGTQIENATQSLVELLIKKDDKKYRVFGIVGMGGIGKTTLASHIYNNEKIKENFPIRVWACVSYKFSETKLLKDIITGAGGSYGGPESKDSLLCILSSILSQRFFIVLDNVWENDVWEHLLRYSFENATASGRIVITTRDTNVARNIRAEIHYVDKMDDDNGWKLLSKIVFGDDEEKEKEKISNLKEIGNKIVKKCDGLPLAIKVIAGVLRSKERSDIEWNKVLKSEVWSMSEFKELPRALFLSYECLSSDLKQCFLYCLLFPEDYKMHRNELIHYWVAEGFVKKTQGDIIMEDLAEDFYRELIGRNLLQQCDGPDNLNDLPGNYCKMHDLLRSLALFLICNESIFLGDAQSPNANPLTKLRRLSMVNMEETVQVPEAVKRKKCLRTLMLRRSPRTKMIENELFERLRFLRIITINDTSLESLPNSIGDLLHLRYLDVDRTNIKELPESIGRLVNLQTLSLSFCNFLHSLPKAVTKLCNLRCLRLEGTPLTHLPKGIGKLKHLNHLQGFVVGHDDRRDTQDDEGCGLEEVQSLCQLRFLWIRRLERAQAGEALVLANSHSLRTLILECRRPEDEVEAIAIQRINKIYNELSPQSTQLQKFEINNFIGTGFPNWMMSSFLGASFPNLTSIKLYNCISCPRLPPLGLLPQLKFLEIQRAYAIKTIGPEFLGPRLTSFPKLEELRFYKMSNWEEWWFGMVEGVGEERRGAPKLLPRLSKLTLDTCPRLRALPPLGMLPELKSLHIEGASAIKIIGPEFLGPRASSAATSFPKLEELRFYWMSNWKEWSFGMVEGVGEERRGAPKLLPHLSKLILRYCPKLRALPEGLRHATNLQQLIITQAFDLIEINNLPFLTDCLQIWGNWSLERVSNLPSLKSLEIDGCPGLEHVENLDKLQFLKFTDYDEQTERLPRWLLELLENAPASLKELGLICRLRFLKTFLKDGPNWPIIQPIPQVRIQEHWHWRPGRSSSYIQYTKDPPTFETHTEEPEESED